MNMKKDYKKNETTNFDKANQWVINALKGDASVFFRFVSVGYRNKYTQWMTPENAKKEIMGRNEFNTWKVERRIYK